MKIAVYHNQPSGGARRALTGFCTYLARNHELDVFTLSTSDHTQSRDEAFADRVTRLDFALTPPKRGHLYLNDIAKRRDYERLDAVNREAAGRIDAGGYDVALVDICRFTQAPSLLQHLNTPCAYYCHEPPRYLYETRWRHPESLYMKARRLLHAPFERSLDRYLRDVDLASVRSATALLTNSEFSRRRLRAIYGRDADVCSPGIDLPPHFQPDEGRHVLSVGSLNAHKGFPFIVRALSLIPAASRPDLHIVANDSNPVEMALVRRLSAALGVKTDVRIGITDEALADEYRDARAFLFAAYDEPLGLAPLEAMSYGLPVVAVAEGGVPEYVTDGVTGLLVGRDEKAFADALLRLLGSPELRDGLGESARATVEQAWTWRDRGPVLEEALLALSRRGSKPAPRLQLIQGARR